MTSSLPHPRCNEPSSYVPSPTRQQTLGWYATERVVLGTQRKTWAAIIRWQFAGLVTVRPINRTSARVVLTEAGRKRIEAGEG